MKSNLCCVFVGLLTLIAGFTSAQQAALDDHGRMVSPGEVGNAGKNQTSLPLRFSKSGSSDPTAGWIVNWLTHYYCIPGMFNDDLIDEAAVNKVCESEKLTSDDLAPYVYWYEGGTESFYSSYYNAPTDSATCERDNDDLVRYFYTRVFSESAREALLSLGHDDSMRVWLNRHEVYSGTDGVYADDMYQIPVNLLHGWNTILVKMYFPHLTSELGSRAFSLRFLDPMTEDPILLEESIDGWCDMNEGGNNWIYAGGAANLHGAQGSRWASDLRLTNYLPRKLRLRINYYREGSSGPAKDAEPDATVAVVLEPFQSRIWSNVLQSLFGLTEEQKGMLAIRGLDEYEGTLGAAGLKIYNKSGNGTFGMNVPFVYRWDGGTCCTENILGVRNGPNYRTNLAGMPMYVLDTDETITVVVWDVESGQTARADFLVHGYFQINDVFDAVGMGSVVTDDAQIQVIWNSYDTGTFWWFGASINDNVTSDPTFSGEGPWFPFPNN